MEKYIKYLSYGVVFLIGVMLAWSLYVKVAGATEIPPKCWEPEETCEDRGDCPVEEEPSCEETQTCEPEVPPVVPPVDVDDDEDNSKCEAPSKVQGFRFQFVGEQNRLRWTPKGSVDKVDIAVYGVDKTTLLYNVRTADDGEYFVPTHTTWHKIRAVGNCGLSKWSKLIN